MFPAHVRRRCDDIVTRAQRVGDVDGVFAAVSPRLRTLVAFDAAVWAATDPATGLPTGPPRLDGLDDTGDCRAYWVHELMAPDIDHFRELARADTPVATLREGAGERPSRRSRHRCLGGREVHDELRAVLRVGDAAWGNVSLLRSAGRPPFGPRETIQKPTATALIDGVRQTTANPSRTSRRRPAGGPPPTAARGAGSLITSSTASR